MPRPHVLLITADQMRFDSVGFVDQGVITPNIDRLAGGGTVFRRAYCVSSVCTPSRAAIFTGRYPHCTGAWSIGVSLNEDELTLCDHLKPLGYRCVANGKMHFRPHLQPGPWGQWTAEPVARRERGRASDGTYYGFDEHHISEDDKIGPYMDWLRQRDPSWAQNPNGDPGDGNLHEHGSLLPPELHQSHWIADQSITTIQDHDPSRPLFMWTSFVDPHHPFDAPRGQVQRYAGAAMPPPPRRPGELDLRPEHLRRQGDRGYWPGGGEEHAYSDLQISHIIRNYRAMISFIDDQIGRILAALEHRGMLEQTIIIFTSDHGELLGDHGLLTKGPWHYEGLTRVPMILAGPGIPAGRQTNGLMENVDILPTLLDLIGSPPSAGVQGRSQVPVLSGQVESARGDAITSYDAHDRGISIKTLRTDRHKLSVFAGETYGELFDLETDPHELHNRYFDPKYSDVRAALYERLAHRLIQDQDPLPVRTAFW